MSKLGMFGLSLGLLAGSALAAYNVSSLYLPNSYPSTIYSVVSLDTAVNWATALVSCPTRYGTIRDATVNSRLGYIAANLSCNAWIAVSQNNGTGAKTLANEPAGEWTWPDGSTYSSFAPGEPNNQNGAENCGLILVNYFSNGPLWVDTSCADTWRCVVCESDYCEDGTVANPATEKCDLTCPVGYYADSSNYCRTCAAGRFAGTPSAATACSDCPVGTFSAAAGATACTSCASGKYTAATGSTTCIDTTNAPSGSGNGVENVSLSLLVQMCLMLLAIVSAFQ